MGFARTIRLEPSRTGIGDPGNSSTWLQVNVMEELTSGNPGTAASRNLPVYMDKYKEIRGKRGADVYNPRTPAEKRNIVGAINNAREKIGKKAISEELFDYNNDKFFTGLDAQIQVMQEDRKSNDPYKYYVDHWKGKYKSEKGKTKVRDAMKNSDSMFDLVRDGPKEYLKNKKTVFGSFLRDVIPGNKNDFVMAADVIGGFGALALTKRVPGAPKVTKSLGQEIMGGHVGDTVRTVAGATAGAASGSLIYDLINSTIRRTKGIANPQDAPTPALEALTAGRNAFKWTLGAAGLAPLAAAARPVLGKVLFGFDGPAIAMSDLAELYRAPVGINVAAGASAQGAGINMFKGAATKYKKTLGKLPFFGGTAMQEKLTLSSLQFSKALKNTIGNYGDDMPIDEVEKFYREQFKGFPTTIRTKLNKEATNAGFKGYVDMLEAEARVNELAPIEHMTDIGELLSKKAQERYRKFAYINNMLYDDFEIKAKSISKNFIPTKNTRMAGETLRAQIEEMKFTLRDGGQFAPMLGDIDEWILKNITNLPDYLSVANVRGLQKDINMLWSDIAGPLKKDQGGAAILGTIRKNLTIDMNDFANWSKELNPEELLKAEAAKKSLLIANDTFSKMAPIYKSPVAKEFKLVDENMFQAGPDLPGFMYSDEIGKMVFRKGISPQRVTDLHDLVGTQAYTTGVKSWINQAFKNSLDSSAPVVREITMPNGEKVMQSMTEEIFNPNKFLKNLNFDDPGIERMMDLAGKDGKAFKSNVEALIDVQARIIEQGLGGTTAQMAARRLSLGGLQSGLSMFTMGLSGSQIVAGGGIGNAAVYSTVLTGLLMRKTAAFLADPEALKAWTRIVEPNASVGAQRNAFVKGMKSLLEDDDMRSDIPKEFHKINNVMQRPGKFLDWLVGSGYSAVMDSMNDGTRSSYNQSRYGLNDQLSFYDAAQLQQEDELANMMSEGYIGSEVDETQVTENAPEENIVPPMSQGGGGEESIFSDDVQESASAPQPLNPQQRVALAGGNLDEAIALGNRRT